MAQLQIDNTSKSYGPLRALDKVSFGIERGEIHAVLGENGAGKSTLMGVLSGFVVPDSGKVLFEDAALPLGEPFRIRHLGIEMVHQHFTLVPQFTVAENLALAHLPSLATVSTPGKLAAAAVHMAEELGWELDPNAKAGSLPVGVQQRIEIVKALSGNAKVLILDEPTAVLSTREVDELFAVLRRLRRRGATIILIAHKLAEVLAIADRVTVLRKGKWIATEARSEVDERELAEWMVGEIPPELSAKQPEAESEPFLAVRDLVVRGERKEPRVNGVSFGVARGQILGIGGVDGNGQIELAEALAGIRKPQSGSISWQSETPLIGYVPQDRQQDGLALKMSVLDNMLITGHRKSELTRGPFVRPGAARSWGERIQYDFSIAVEDLDTPAGSLSGGNQQKVVVGRTLESVPNALIAVNPTRGLDIRATRYVHEQILRARASGTTIVLFSTDLDELNALSDEFVFMSGGRFVPGRDAAAMMGSPIIHNPKHDAADESSTK